MKILGISPFHDSSIVVLHDGNIEYFSKEERLTRKKRDAFPWKSLSYVTNNITDIDLIVICSPTFNDPFNDILEEYLKKYYNCTIKRLCDKHHLAHASLAFYNSGFEQSLTVVIDRNGSKVNGLRESESVFISSYPNNFKPIYKSYWFENIGEKYDVENDKTLFNISKQYAGCEVQAESTCNITKVYETATSLIGEHALENGKTMGLASYGKDTKHRNLFVDSMPISNYFIHSDGDYFKPVLLKEHLSKFLHEPYELTKDNYSYYANYSYQVQKQTQEVVLNLVKKYVEQTGIKNVCISGGYGLNVIANSYLVKNLPDVNFYFEPMADDTGNSIGSAMYYYRDITKNCDITPIKDTFFNGNKHAVPIDVGNSYTTVDDIVNYLTQGKIVAVYNQMAEAGPRALGNRSILFDARNKNAKDIVNVVKNREWYRPFACSILEEDFEEYFNTLGLSKSEFMTMAFDVKSDKIPGVVHVDNSCRVQTVNKSIPYFYELLNKFKEKTGVPVLLNTSFNLAGEALVESPTDAISTYKKSDIDVLWFPEKQIALRKNNE